MLSNGSKNKLISENAVTSLYDGCMTISNRDKSAFEIVPQLIQIGHKPTGNKRITHTFQILAKMNWIIIS